jgi:hypothetical protein
MECLSKTREEGYGHADKTSYIGKPAQNRKRFCDQVLTVGRVKKLKRKDSR